MTDNKFINGRGLDCGTGFLVESRMTNEGELVTKSVRDSFLTVKPANKMVLSTMRKGLVKAGINFLENETEGKLIILGQDSLNRSVEMQTVLQRPMSKGVISSSEQDALPMFKALIKELLGSPQVKDEKILFTVPAPPIDGKFDVIYHCAVIESILSDLGFKGKPINEAHALGFSELESEDFTGITISMGSGMTNLAVVNVAELIVKFSVAKGGDYIDQSTAASLGFDPQNQINSVTPNMVTLIKENGVDIINPDPTDRIQMGIAAHYRALVKYVVENMVAELSKPSTQVPKFLKPVPVVVAGGTSLAKGVLELFKQELDLHKSRLPFEVKEVRHSSKALTSVAEGCLLALLADE